MVKVMDGREGETAPEGHRPDDSGPPTQRRGRYIAKGMGRDEGGKSGSRARAGQRPVTAPTGPSDGPKRAECPETADGKPAVGRFQMLAGTGGVWCGPAKGER